MPDEQSEATNQTVRGEEARRNLSREQKTGFVLLLIFGILGLALGILQIRNTMLRPFALTSAVPADLKDKVNDVSTLSFRDTDHDGLNDYEERYVYGTSPYLYDTFGYGMSDKVVVDRGLPPCANAGKDCSDASTPVGPTSTIPSFTTSTEDVIDFNKTINDPVQIRKLLLQSGMQQAVLDKLSDADLMALVAQTMAATSTATSTR